MQAIKILQDGSTAVITLDNFQMETISAALGNPDRVDFCRVTMAPKPEDESELRGQRPYLLLYGRRAKNDSEERNQAASFMVFDDKYSGVYVYGESIVVRSEETEAGIRYLPMTDIDVAQVSDSCKSYAKQHTILSTILEALGAGQLGSILGADKKAKPEAPKGDIVSLEL